MLRVVIIIIIAAFFWRNVNEKAGRFYLNQIQVNECETIIHYLYA